MTNQTYIEEKKQEIEKAILEYLDDNGWKYGEDFYGWLIPSITQALQDAIKYGEEIAIEELKKLRKEIDTVEIKRYGIAQGIEIVDSPYNRQAQVHNAILDDILAKLTTLEEK